MGQVWLYIGIFLFVMILLAIITVFSLIFWLQSKNRRALVDKRLATILTPSGDRDDRLLPINFNQLKDKDTDTGEDIIYFVRPDKSFKVWWPPGRPRFLQVNINSFLYKERCSEPEDPYNRPTVMDGLVLGNITNISVSRAMVGRSEEIVRDQQSLRPPEKKKIPVFLFVILGVILLVIIGAVVFFMKGT